MPCRSVLYLSILTILGFGSALADTIHVPADQPTIQAGIDAAAAGDTVLVAPGTYSGPGNRDLDFGGVNLHLLADGFPGDVVIDCNSEFDGNARGFIFQNGETAESHVAGFMIRNCWAPSYPSYGNSGGGMLLIDSNPTISGNAFFDNSANGGSGAGVACVGTSNPVISDCDFNGNYTNNYGSAVYIAPGANAVIEECRAWDNGGNGAVAAANSTPLIVRSAFGGNWGIDSRGGAAFRFWSGTNATILGCLITGNKTNVTSRGGSALLLLDTSTASVHGCTIAGNYSEDVGGAVLLASGSDASLFMEGTILWGNCADNGGDQIYLDSATGIVDIECSVVDSAGVTATGVLYQDAIFEDPLFCDPEDCSSAPSIMGEYTVAMTSPALEENNSCGLLIGIFGLACDDITPVRPTTWGKLKTLYQGD